MGVPADSGAGDGPAEFWRRAHRHLIRYSGAGEFVDEIIESAQGSYVTTAGGRRILDSPRAR